MTAHAFSLVFLFFLVFSTLLQLWLKNRHLNHVLAHRDAVPSDFASQIDLEAHQKAADYTAAKVRFGRIGIVWEALVLAGFTLGGAVGWLDGKAHALLGSGVWAGLALIVALALANFVLTLPFSLYATFVLEEKFGFNNTTPKVFVSDIALEAFLGAVLGLPIIALILWLMNAAGTYWWIYAWAAWVAFNLFVMAIYPVVIAPMFNKIVPLEDEALKERITNLLAHCGYKSKGVFVKDGSKRSTHGNAEFQGYGKTKRIVFYDTLAERLEPREMEAVLAHELGHFKHRHNIKRMLTLFGLFLILMAILGLLKDASWFYQGLGVDVPSTAAALVLFALSVSVFTFPFGWIASRISRKHEYEADRFAVETVDADSLVSGLVKLYRDNAATLTPDPLHSLFYDSHPPASLRIAALRASQ